MKASRKEMWVAGELVVLQKLTDGAANNRTWVNGELVERSSDNPRLRDWLNWNDRKGGDPHGEEAAQQEGRRRQEEVLTP